MALTVGTLTGFLDLDAGPFEKGIGKAFDMMGDKKWQVMGAAAGVAAATALASGLMSAVDAEGAVNKLAAQLDLTKEESAKAGKIAGALYADNYGDSMEDVTAATGAVMSSIKGMRDASEGDVVALTGQLMSLASAMDIDVAQAAQVAGQMVTTGLAKDGVEAADLLTVALQKVPAALRGDILDITDEYSIYFQQLGIGGEAAMELLVNASAKGAYGIDKTADALKEFTLLSTNMSKETGEAYKTIGLDQDEMTKSILAGGDEAEMAFGKVIGGILGIEDPIAKSQAAMALFGAPLEDLSTADIPKFIESLANMGSEGFGSVAGAAAEMDATLNGGAGASLKTFTRTAEQTLSDLGASVLPLLTPILQNLSEWAPIIGPLVLALGAFAAIMWVVNAAMAANPITWIILGIVALIAIIIALVMNWDTVVAFLQGAWAGFVGWFMGVMDGFLSWWSGIWGGFLGFWGDAFTAAKIVATNIWTAIVEWIKGIPGWILNAIMPIALLHIQFALWILSIKDAAVQKFNDIVAWVKGVPGMILAGLAAIANINADMGRWILGVKDAAVTKFEDLVTWVKGVPQKILDGLGNVKTLLADAGVQIIQGFLDGLKEKYEEVKTFVGGIAEWIAEHKGPKAYDLALLVPAGGWIMTGLSKGLEAYMPTLGRQLSDISWMIQNGIDPELGINGSYAFSSRGGVVAPARSGESQVAQRLGELTAAVRDARTIHVEAPTNDDAAAMSLARRLEGAF